MLAASLGGGGRSLCSSAVQCVVWQCSISCQSTTVQVFGCGWRYWRCMCVCVCVATTLGFGCTQWRAGGKGETHAQLAKVVLPLLYLLPQGHLYLCVG